MVSTIGALIASMDRQSATVQQHVDAVKEYTFWWQLPRSLALRIRRFYEYYCKCHTDPNPRRRAVQIGAGLGLRPAVLAMSQTPTSRRLTSAPSSPA